MKLTRRIKYWKRYMKVPAVVLRDKGTTTTTTTTTTLQL
jgi:hypothetical protein